MNNVGAATQIDFLRHAIEDGDTTKILQILQENDVDVTAVDENGDTMLHLILMQSINFVPRFSPDKIIEMMDIFISRGVDPNIKNKNQVTVLHLAIAGELKDVVDYLLRHKCNIKVVDDKGYSIAHYFIAKSCELLLKKRYQKTTKEDDSSFVEWLVSRGVDFDLKKNAGQSALHLAIKFNLQHILATLFETTRDVNVMTKDEKRNLLQLFLQTIYANSRAIIKIHYVRLCYYQSIWPLHSQNFPSEYVVEIVQILLDRGVSVDHKDNNGMTPLQLAIRYNIEPAIVQMIMDRFANINDELAVTLVYDIVRNKRYRSPCFDHLKLLDSLIAKGININGQDAHGKTCLYYAVMYNDLKAIELMKSRVTPDFSVLTNDGENLLHALANVDLRTFSTETSPDPSLNVIFDMLVSEGCDVLAKNNKGQTSLHWAAGRSNFTVAQKLIAHGVDVNCRDYEKDLCPLHEAISHSWIEMAELLLDNGANVNSKSKDGRPLHLATDFRFRTNDMVTTLLKNRAEVNARDHRGDTALAEALRHESDVQALLEHGADINDASVIRVLPHCVKNHAGKILMQHWIKLRTANLPCHSRYPTCLVANEESEHLREGCLREIEIMKRTFIDTRTSWYYWLHMDLSQRYILSQNEKLRGVVDSPVIEKQFPHYSTVILGTYRDTLRRKSLFESAKEAWLRLTGIPLPDLCLECVFAHLSTGDLFEMAEPTDDVY